MFRKHPNKNQFTQKGAVSNRRFETAPRAKKATVGFFAPGNLRFSLKNTIKFDRTMGENDGVEPSSKNHGGVDQMQNAFETPPYFVPFIRFLAPRCPHRIRWEP